MPSFEAQLRAFETKVKNLGALTVRNTIMGVAASVINKSPVAGRGTWVPPPGYIPGQFKANWNGAMGAPDLSTTEETDPTGELSMVRINSAIPAKYQGDIFYITNSLPYAEVLESGRGSPQAPFGMVGLTILEFDSIFQKAFMEAEAGVSVGIMA